MKKRFACRHRVDYVPVPRPATIKVDVKPPLKIGLFQFILEIKAGIRTR